MALPSNEQTSQDISRDLVDKLQAYQGTYYYPQQGLNQVVYPDMYDGDNPSAGIYWPGWEIVDLFAAYSGEANGVTGDNQAIQFTDEPNPVVNDLSGVDLNTNGLAGTLTQLYGAMTYGLSADDQKTLAEAKVKADAAVKTVAKDMAAAFAGSDQAGLVKKGQKIFNTGTDPSESIKTAFQFFATCVANYPDQLIDPTSGVYQAWKAATNKASDGVDVNNSGREYISQEKKNEFIGIINSNLVNGEYANTWPFFQSFGPEGYFGTGEYTMPIGETLYTQYAGAVGGTEYTTWKSLTALVNRSNGYLTSATAYLTDLASYNSNPNIEGLATPTNAYLPVNSNDNIPGAKTLAPWFTSSAVKGDPSGSSINYSLSTESISGNSATSSSGQTIEWDASAGVSGWWYSASASDSGSSVEKESMSSYTKDIQTTKGVFEWSDIATKSITLDSNWYLGNAIAQAWTNFSFPAQDKNFQGGYAFKTMDLANQYLQTSLYNVDHLAYGDIKSTLTAEVKTESDFQSEKFKSFENHFSASGGFGWGPFSMGSSTSIDNESVDTEKQWSSTKNGNSLTVTNEPLKGLSTVEGAGDPAAVIGVGLKEIAKAKASVATPGTTKAVYDSNTKHTAAGEDDEVTEEAGYAVTDRDDITISDPTVLSTATNAYWLLDGDDTHFGNSNDDHIHGGNGNDLIAGFDGDDYIYGDDGDDGIYGGSGENHIWGGNGADYIVFEREYVEEGAFNKVWDWKGEDSLSFTGYTPDQVTSSHRNLYLDGEHAAKFYGVSSNGLEQLIADAHYAAF